MIKTRTVKWSNRDDAIIASIQKEATSTKSFWRRLIHENHRPQTAILQGSRCLWHSEQKERMTRGRTLLTCRIGGHEFKLCTNCQYSPTCHLQWSLTHRTLAHLSVSSGSVSSKSSSSTPSTDQRGIEKERRVKREGEVHEEKVNTVRPVLDALLTKENTQHIPPWLRRYVMITWHNTLSSPV